jgi:hypothetical protein
MTADLGDAAVKIFTVAHIFLALNFYAWLPGEACK